MKKMFCAVLVAALLSFGLVAVTSSPSSAACPYTSCIPTRTKAKVKNFVAVGTKVTVCGKVRPIGSNATPTGRLKINVRHRSGAIVQKKFVPYQGGRVCIKTPKLVLKGQYALRVKYKPGPNSVFRKSSGIKKFQAR